MQLPGVITGAGPIVNAAAVLGCIYFGVRLVQIVRQLVQGDQTSRQREEAARQLRADLKEDLADQLELLAARLENMVTRAVQEAKRG